MLCGLFRADAVYLNSGILNGFNKTADLLLGYLRPFGKPQRPHSIPLIMLGNGLVGKTALLRGIERHLKGLSLWHYCSALFVFVAAPANLLLLPQMTFRNHQPRLISSQEQTKWFCLR